MGMFDTVFFKCPTCNAELEEQTKSGECLLRRYHQSSVPVVAVSGLDNKIYCDNCQSQFKVNFPERISLTLVPNIDTEEGYD